MTMTQYVLMVGDGATANESAKRVVKLELFEFEVVNPMVKRGVRYEKGSSIKLDKLTASRFLAIGDIKEIA